MLNKESRTKVEKSKELTTPPITHQNYWYRVPHPGLKITNLFHFSFTRIYTVTAIDETMHGLEKAATVIKSASHFKKLLLLITLTSQIRKINQHSLTLSGIR